jgi:hypothetical protein
MFMKNYQVQNFIIYFFPLYFLIAFLPMRVDFANSYIPFGQILFLSLLSIAIISSPRRSFIYANNFDTKLLLIFSFYFLSNSIIQSFFNEADISYRLNSIVASIIPIFFFFFVKFLDAKDDLINNMEKYFFIGCFIFALYYFESFASIRFSDVHNGATRVVGQRDSIYLNFALLAAIFFNYRKRSHLYKFLGLLTILSCLVVMIFAQTRLGYILLITNVIFFCIFSLRRLILIFIPIVIASLLVWFFILRNFPDVYELMGNQIDNNFYYSVARFNTMINSILSIFDSNVSYLDGSLRTRFATWKIILENVISSPHQFLFGNGELGVHTLNESILIVDPRWYYPFEKYYIMNSESQFFDTLFRRGFIGLVFLAMILSRVVFLSRYLMKWDKKFYSLYTSFYYGFLATVVTSLFLPILRDRTFVIFFFVAYAILSTRASIIKSN